MNSTIPQSYLQRINLEIENTRAQSVNETLPLSVRARSEAKLEGLMFARDIIQSAQREIDSIKNTLNVFDAVEIARRLSPESFTALITRRFDSELLRLGLLTVNKNTGRYIRTTRGNEVLLARRARGGAK
jgi:hypothetical protein